MIVVCLRLVEENIVAVGFRPVLLIEVDLVLGGVVGLSLL